MKNREIADILSKIAEALSLKGENYFKIRAYNRASHVIKDLPEDIEKYYREDTLTKIPGVGDGIAKKIKEYIEKGSMSKYEEVTRDVPESLLSLLEIRDLGPKTLRILHEELGVENVDDLEKVIENGSFAKIEGLGDKSAEKIMNNIILFREKKGESRRFLRGEVMVIVESVIDKLKKFNSVGRVSTAGSYRRMKDTVGDLDILVESNDSKDVMEKFISLPDVEKVLESGGTKTSVILKGFGIRMDVRVVPDESFGAALQYFTGSKDHNVRIRSLALKNGLKINEYGVFRDDKKLGGRDEKDVYNILGLDYIPPELREDRGEIERALRGNLPELIEYNDIKGDLHIHSNYSDGENSIEDLAVKAIECGYSYIGITDHSKTASYAQGLSVDTLKKQINEIDRLNDEFSNIRILKGIESDILPDGSLDYEGEILELLDFVIGAIHSGFKKNVMRRVEKALENPYLTILAHPTGRLISGRKGYDVDIKSIIKMAKEKEKILEINAYYDRLDLDDYNAREAYNEGVKLCINTDAHNLRMYDWMVLGIGIARRAWINSKSVINTYNLKSLIEEISRNG